MTHPSAAPAEPASTPTASPDLQWEPTDTLITLIVGLLTPLFVGAANSNLHHAQMAAMATLNAYRARTEAELILAAQIIGFGLASLGSLSLSMQDDQPINTTIRLRNNANALSRAADRSRKALDHSLKAAPPEPAPTPEATAADTARDTAREAAMHINIAQAQAAVTAAAPQPVSPADPHGPVWANACLSVAKEIEASLPGLGPTARRTASVRANALSTSAHHFLANPPA